MEFTNTTQRFSIPFFERFIAAFVLCGKIVRGSTAPSSDILKCMFKFGFVRRRSPEFGFDALKDPSKLRIYVSSLQSLKVI